MGGAEIIGIALGVGVIVYVLSLRSPDERLGADPIPEGEGEPAIDLHLLVLRSPDPRWRTRLGGVAGLMLVVTAAALVLAISVYQLGHVTNRMIQGFMGY